MKILNKETDILHYRDRGWEKERANLMVMLVIQLQETTSDYYNLNQKVYILGML